MSFRIIIAKIYILLEKTSLMIRQYKAEEIDTLINIWLEGSKISHHFIPDSFWEEKAGEMREVYIPASNTFVYIADDQSQPLGFTSTTLPVAASNT